MAKTLFGKKADMTTLLVVAILAVAVVMYFNPFKMEGFAGYSQGASAGCGAFAAPYGGEKTGSGTRETFSTCYQRKQIYLNSCDPDEPSGHGDVHLEQRWGKLYITINCNLPYALGGVFHTAWGAYTGVIFDSRTKQSINLGSLVRHGDRFYKLSTELLGDYSNYDKIAVYRQTEDYLPKMVLIGSITGQQCSSL